MHSSRVSEAVFHSLLQEATKRDFTMSAMFVQNMSFKAGRTLVVTGVPNADCKRFAFNIGNSADEIALHQDHRFNHLDDERKVVCNSYLSGKWGMEQRGGSFPFNCGEEFQVRITFNKTEFKIILPDDSKITFPNHLGAEKYNYMRFDFDARIHRIEIK